MKRKCNNFDLNNVVDNSRKTMIP